jgi:hypothetical protein
MWIKNYMLVFSIVSTIFCLPFLALSIFATIYAFSFDFILLGFISVIFIAGVQVMRVYTNGRVYKIEIINDTAKFTFVNSKTFVCSKFEICKIVGSPSWYQFFLASGKKLSAYKYYKPISAIRSDDPFRPLINNLSFPSAKIDI